MHLLKTSLLAAIVGISSASHAEALRLTEVNPDGCVPGVFYNQVLSKPQILAKRFPKQVKVVAHDNCSAGNELVIGINGKIFKLSRKLEKGTQQEIYDGQSFYGQGYSISVTGGRMILDLPEKNEVCASQWKKVTMLITKDGKRLRVNGTLVYSC